MRSSWVSLSEQSFTALPPGCAEEPQRGLWAQRGAQADAPRAFKRECGLSLKPGKTALRALDPRLMKLGVSFHLHKDSK